MEKTFIDSICSIKCKAIVENAKIVYTVITKITLDKENDDAGNIDTFI